MDDNINYDEVLESSGLDGFAKEMTETVKPSTQMPEQFVPSVNIEDIEDDIHSGNNGNNMGDLFGEPDDDIFEDEPEEEEGTDTPQFDYLDSHKDTARFILIQLDKAMSFILYMFSGVSLDEWDKYRVRKDGSPHGEKDDYELMALASIIKKYGLTLSVEFIFISMFLMTYTASATQAWDDRKETNKIKKGTNKSDDDKKPME